MSKILSISPEKCLYCRSCELVCSFIGLGEFDPNESAPIEFDPNKSAVNVMFCEETASSVPVMCMQCEDAACMRVCPVGALSRDENGVVISDPKKCILCKMCISACPMGNISFSSVENKIVKCDLCGGNPKCAKICPSGTIKFVESSTANIIKKREIAENFKNLFA